MAAGGLPGARGIILRTTTMKTVVIRQQAVKRVQNFYLWVYADEIVTAPRQSYPGEIVAVHSPAGEVLGTAFYNPAARVALRLISREAIRPEAEFWRRRLQAALERRQGLWLTSNALRLVYAEADYLPGLIIDSYDGHLAVQARTAGVASILPLLLGVLREIYPFASAWERSDVAVRQEEGLAPSTGQLVGTTPEDVEVHENGIRFLVDIQRGQKTGFFTDQRDARRTLADRVGPGQRFLDAFAYTGGFGLYAAARGATVTAVDKDTAALERLGRNAALNGLDDRIETVSADLFQWLPERAAAGECYDVISLDPPALIKYKNQRSKGRGLFMDLIRPCLQMLPPGGLLHLSTCAYHVSGALLLEATRISAGETGCRLRLVAETMQAADHPYIIQMPETLYLKGYTFQRLDDPA